MTTKQSIKKLTAGISVIGLLVITASMAQNNGIDAENTKQKEVNKVEEKLKSIAASLKKLDNDELVKQLGNENFNIREEASKAVLKRGRKILPMLLSASLSDNPEIVSRAEGLIRFIKLGVLPVGSARLTKLINAFESGNFAEKKRILRDLASEKAYTQMLIVLSEMKNKKEAKRLYNSHMGIGFIVARKSILKGDTDAAIEQLKLVPFKWRVTKSLAYLYRMTGRLDQELAKVDNRKNKPRKNTPEQEWERTLKLEQQDRGEIRKYGEKRNYPTVLANLDLLDGNPETLYKEYALRAKVANKATIAVLKAQYDGENEKFVKFIQNKKMKFIYDKSIEIPKIEIHNTDVVDTIRALATTGASKMLGSYMVKHKKYELFSHLDLQERPKEALAVLGITDVKSLQNFIKVNTRLAVDQIEIDKEDLIEFLGVEGISYSTRLMKLANFYHKRGVYKTAKDIMTPLLNEFVGQKNSEWYSVIRKIANLQMYDLAIDLTLERGDEDDTYQQVINQLFENSAEIDFIWNTLKDRDEVSAEKAFRDLGVILGVYQSEIENYEVVKNDLIKIGRKKGIRALGEMREALLFATNIRQDSISSQVLAQQLLENEGDKSKLPGRKLIYLVELVKALNWKKLVKMLDEDSSFIDSNAAVTHFYTIYSIAKRKLGDIDGANKLLKTAKTLSLGMDDDLRQMALEHYLAGYYAISNEILERLLIVSSPRIEDRSYGMAFALLSQTDNAYIHLKKWSKAAAFSFINSVSNEARKKFNGEYYSINEYNKLYYNTQFTRGVELYQKGEKAKGLKMLKNAHGSIYGHGLLGDHFYPVVRKLDIPEQYDLWVNKSFQHIESSINQYPECASTYNTIAWLYAKSVRRLDEGLQYSKKSLELLPLEAAYLDTMAELYHAKGERENAIKWGEKAVMTSKYGALGRGFFSSMRNYNLSSQLDRFKEEAHPQP